MSKQKYKPLDSEQDQPKDHQAVKEEDMNQSNGDAAGLKDPAGKRKYSEQPPTRHNSKT